MPRRKQSVFEDLIDIAARLPWWAGVVLAVSSYIGLHQLAIMEVAAPVDTRDTGTFVGLQLYKTFAMYLQYIVPGLFLLGSLVLALARRKRKKERITS